MGGMRTAKREEIIRERKEENAKTHDSLADKRKSGQERMVRPSGLEPPTPTMSRWCSNQLSYGRIMVRLIGLEPTTPTMSRWCSNQLSYKRIMVRSIGLEPTTPTMSRWCSNQLSYERNVVVTTGTHISDREGLWQEANVTFLSERMRLRKFYPYCLYFTDDKGEYVACWLFFAYIVRATGHGR